MKNFLNHICDAIDGCAAANDVRRGPMSKGLTYSRSELGASRIRERPRSGIFDAGIVFGAAMVIVIPLLFGARAHAADGEDIYKKQNWRGALEFYKSRADSPGACWEDYYNAGNCFFRMGKYPEARLYYLRAKKLSPRSSDINYNLRVLDEKLGLPDTPEGALAALAALFTEDEFKTAAVIVTWLFFIAASLHVFTKSELFLWLAAALFVTGAFAWGALYAKMNGGPDGGYGIVMREEGMQSGPGASYKVIASVPAGMKAAIYDGEEGWIFVRVADSSGWIRRGALEKIN